MIRNILGAFLLLTTFTDAGEASNLNTPMPKFSDGGQCFWKVECTMLPKGNGKMEQFCWYAFRPC